MPSLTPSQQRVYDALPVHFRSHGRPPTIRELCRQVGFASPNAPLTHLRALQAQGLIVRDPLTSRGFRLADQSAIGEEPPEPAPSLRPPTVSLLNNRIVLDFGVGCVYLDREQAVNLAGELLARVRSLRRAEGMHRGEEVGAPSLLRD